MDLTLKNTLHVLIMVCTLCPRDSHFLHCFNKPFSTYNLHYYFGFFQHAFDFSYWSLFSRIVRDDNFDIIFGDAGFVCHTKGACRIRSVAETTLIDSTANGVGRPTTFPHRVPPWFPGASTILTGYSFKENLHSNIFILLMNFKIAFRMLFAFKRNFLKLSLPIIII